MLLIFQSAAGAGGESPNDAYTTRPGTARWASTFRNVSHSLSLRSLISLFSACAAISLRSFFQDFSGTFYAERRYHLWSRLLQIEPVHQHGQFLGAHRYAALFLTGGGPTEAAFLQTLRPEVNGNAIVAFALVKFRYVDPKVRRSPKLVDCHDYVPRSRTTIDENRHWHFRARRHTVRHEHIHLIQS